MSTGSDVRAAGMVVGVGTDLVAIDRLAAALERRPALAERLFTPAELALTEAGTTTGRTRSLAARLAGKEAVMKSLGAGMGQAGVGASSWPARGPTALMVGWRLGA